MKMWFYCIAYAILGFTDLILSQIAFSLGVSEGNPVLQWLIGKELSIPAKIFLTLLVCFLMIFLDKHKPKTIRIVGLSAIILMTLINILHVWGINQLLNSLPPP